MCQLVLAELNGGRCTGRTGSLLGGSVKGSEDVMDKAMLIFWLGSHGLRSSSNIIWTYAVSLATRIASDSNSVSGN